MSYTKEQLVLFEEAEKMYPPGTEFICLNGNTKCTVTESNPSAFGLGDNYKGLYWSYSIGDILALKDRISGAWIRRNGEWAKITKSVKKNKEEFIRDIFKI